MPSYSRRSESRDRDRHRSSRKRSRSRDESSDRKRKRSEKRRDKKREKNRSKSSTPNERIYAPANVACELDGGNINMAQLDKKTVDWLHEKINDQVSAPTIFSRRSNLLCINLYFLIKSLKRGRTCTRGRSARKTEMLESN
uniref:Uncharacterized protein n=1 Tax=Meloidogyne javanica TaxID=6303 RepID=A0A915N4D4_MELJA